MAFASSRVLAVRDDVADHRHTGGVVHDPLAGWHDTDGAHRRPADVESANGERGCGRPRYRSLDRRARRRPQLVGAMGRECASAVADIRRIRGLARHWCADRVRARHDGDAVFYVAGQAPIKSVPQTMYGGILAYVLLSIPFFVYAGFIMTEGGLSRRLAEWVIALVGRLPGGLLQVIVVAMYVVSGISGSKVADVAAVGSSMKGMLRRGGYDMGEAGAVLAASAIMGETIPPS